MKDNRINEASNYIKGKTKFAPKLAIILGSGLGSYGDALENAEYYEYKDIPHFPVSTIEGHRGRFVISENVLCMQGRFHFYEGYSMEEVTFPIRVMKKLGIQSLIVTNAAGGVNTDFTEGNLMLITDHINFMGQNPLRGENLEEFGPRFPDMSDVYDRKYLKLAKELSASLEMDLWEGVYMGFSGPSFETPAEIKMARLLGADAVGMSTVPEAIVAGHCGIRVLGISCITNLAAGILDQPLSHAEVIETTNRVKDKFITFVHKLIELIAEQLK